MGVKIYNWLTEELSKEKTITAKDQDTACLIGLRSRVYQFQPVEKLKAETDFKYRRWYVQHFFMFNALYINADFLFLCRHRQWWIQVRNIMKVILF